MKTYKTYSNAFNWETVIYSIQDVKLPFPLHIETALYWVAAMGVMAVIGLLFGVIINAAVHFGVIPLAIVWVAKQFNPEDKPSLIWLRDFITHLAEDPKEIWGFDKPDKYDDECVFDNVITYREDSDVRQA